MLALLAITCVFLLVPRGINVGAIEVHSTKMTFNSTTKTYRIILQADVPIYNPNYLQVWYGLVAKIFAEGLSSVHCQHRRCQLVTF